MQGAAQVCQSYHRAEGAHQRNAGNQNAVKPHRVPLVQHGRDKEHGQVKYQNHGVGACCIVSGGAFHPLFVFGKRFGAAVHFRQTCLPLAVLLNLRQSPETVQYEAAQVTGFGAKPHTVFPTEPGGDEGHRHADYQVSGQSQQALTPMVLTHKQTHEDGKQGGNGSRRDGVGIEYLKQLNVGGNNRDQVALVLSLQLCRAEPAQSLKDFVPDQGQQFKRDEVIASLLPIAQHRPQQRKNRHADK